MKIVIAGGDRSGQNLMDFFQQHKRFDITLIESDSETCEWISERYSDVKIIWGDATFPKTLEEADVENADVFIAVTSSDQSNILAAKAAKKMGLEKVIAKVTNPEYYELAELMEFDYILEPAEALSAEIITRLQGVDFVKLVENLHLDIEFNVIKVEDKPVLNGTDIAEFDEHFENLVYPIFVIREGKYLLAVEVEKIEADDEIIYLNKTDAPHRKTRKLIKFLGE